MKKEEIIQFAKEISFDYIDENILAVFIDGSFARNDYLPYSDIDIHFIFKKEYKKNYAVFGKIYNKIRFDLVFDDLETMEELIRKHFGNYITKAIILYDKFEIIKNWKNKYSKANTLCFIDKYRIYKSLRYKSINHLMSVNNAIFENDIIKANYILKGIIDEIIQKERLICGDPLWEQSKSNIDWIRIGSRDKLKELILLCYTKLLYKYELLRVCDTIAEYTNGYHLYRKYKDLQEVV